jgi:hypothetical protein
MVLGGNSGALAGIGLRSYPSAMTDDKDQNQESESTQVEGDPGDIGTEKITKGDDPKDKETR